MRFARWKKNTRARSSIAILLNLNYLFYANFQFTGFPLASGITRRIPVILSDNFNFQYPVGQFANETANRAFSPFFFLFLFFFFFFLSRPTDVRLVRKSNFDLVGRFLETLTAEVRKGFATLKWRVRWPSAIPIACTFEQLQFLVSWHCRQTNEGFPSLCVFAFTWPRRTIRTTWQINFDFLFDCLTRERKSKVTLW